MNQSVNQGLPIYLPQKSKKGYCARIQRKKCLFKWIFQRKICVADAKDNIYEKKDQKPEECIIVSILWKIAKTIEGSGMLS